jgi:pilus assembly protein CpaF
LAQSVEELVARARGFGRVQDLFARPGVTEIMINGPGPVWIESDGTLEPSDLRLEPVDVAVLVERVLQPLGLRVDPLSPYVDARLPDGSRINITVPPVALDGPIVTIRRFTVDRLPLDAFGSPEVVKMMAGLVEQRASVLIIGGTGAGKTTLLNALGSHVPARTRIVTIEDTAELQLPGEHVIRLEARPANREGFGEVTIRDLVRNALRMRPDRLIVGEVRGGEAFDLLLALNTGHRGSLTTCHANGPLEGLRRLETLALLGGIDLPIHAIRQQLVEAIDVVVHVERAGRDRRIASVCEVSLPGSQLGGTDEQTAATFELWPNPVGPPRRAAVRAALNAASDASSNEALVERSRLRQSGPT